MKITVATLDCASKTAKLTRIELPEGSSVADACAAVGKPCNGNTAVFCRKADAGTVLHDGDRLDIGEELLIDPMQARRLRAENKNATGRGPIARHGGKHQLAK